MTRAAGLAGALALGLALVLAGALAIRSPAPDAAPLDDATVVATLQTAGTAIPDALRAALRATRARPDDPAAAKAAARALIAEGRLAGDSRLVGAALGALRPFLAPDAAQPDPAQPDAETLFLAATARQYQHDFPGALDLLDRALALDPRDANALLTRATIQIVTGRLDRADADCRRLHALPRPDLGFLCQSTALAPTAAAPQVYDRLESILAADALDPALRGYALDLMGEISVFQDEGDRARAHYAAVLAQDPDALRVRLALADLLIADGADAAALDLLAPAPDVDGALLRRAIAAERLGRDEIAAPATAELARRFRQNVDLGLTAHAREEARFYLQIAPDPALALARAEVNWAFQHEIEDAQLLIDASLAADAPQAAAPVLAWMTEQQVSVPALRIPEAVRAAAR